VKGKRSNGLLKWASALSLSAALVHGINVGEHLREWWGYGLFFLFAAAAQSLYGLILLLQPWRYDQSGGLRDGGRQARAYYLSGAIANSIFIGLYVVTRTSGIPIIGPQAGRVERVTGLGVFANVAEALLVFVLMLLIRELRPRTPAEAARYSESRALDV